MAFLAEHFLAFLGSTTRPCTGRQEVQIKKMTS